MISTTKLTSLLAASNCVWTSHIGPIGVLSQSSVQFEAGTALLSGPKAVTGDSKGTSSCRSSCRSGGTPRSDSRVAPSSDLLSPVLELGCLVLSAVLESLCLARNTHSSTFEEDSKFYLFVLCVFLFVMC